MYTQEQIEASFKTLHNTITSKKSDGTSCEDVLLFMYENTDTIWWMSWDFIGKTLKNGKRLSHRAPARASDLAIHNPLLVEDRKVGRFNSYRLRTENINLIQKRLGESGELKKADIKIEKIRIEQTESGPVAIRYYE